MTHTLDSDRVIAQSGHCIMKRAMVDEVGAQPLRAFVAPSDTASQPDLEPDCAVPELLPTGREFASSEGSKRLMRQCRSLAAALAREREELFSALEPKVVDLALEIARCILQHEARVDRALIERTVAAAIEAVPQAVGITVRVSPDDVAAVAHIYEADGKTRVIADESISPGGCALDTDWGDIDATIETQLNRLQAELMAPRSES